MMTLQKFDGLALRLVLSIVLLISLTKLVAIEASSVWQDFGNDPDWKKARSESEANGKLVEKMERVFMAATDYSPVK